MTTMAYDYGDAIRVVDIDDRGKTVPGSAVVLRLGPTLNATLEAAGYQVVGTWSPQGSTHGVEVRTRD